MSEMHTCSRCGWSYPEDVLLSPVVGSLVKKPVCGICALAIVNAVHGTRMRTFHGELAEDVRQDALEARRLKLAKPPALVEP